MTSGLGSVLSDGSVELNGVRMSADLSRGSIETSDGMISFHGVDSSPRSVRGTIREAVEGRDRLCPWAYPVPIEGGKGGAGPSAALAARVLRWRGDGRGEALGGLASFDVKDGVVVVRWPVGGVWDVTQVFPVELTPAWLAPLLTGSSLSVEIPAPPRSPAVGGAWLGPRPMVAHTVAQWRGEFAMWPLLSPASLGGVVVVVIRGQSLAARVKGEFCDIPGKGIFRSDSIPRSLDRALQIILQDAFTLASTCNCPTPSGNLTIDLSSSLSFTDADPAGSPSSLASPPPLTLPSLAYPLLSSEVIETSHVPDVGMFKLYKDGHVLASFDNHTIVTTDRDREICRAVLPDGSTEKFLASHPMRHGWAAAAIKDFVRWAVSTPMERMERAAILRKGSQSVRLSSQVTIMVEKTVQENRDFLNRIARS